VIEGSGRLGIAEFDEEYFNGHQNVVAWAVFDMKIRSSLSLYQLDI
jgi:hypothetical protein